MAPTAVRMEDAADRIQVSVATLRRMVKQNRIKAVKVSARRIVIPEAEIVRLLNAETVAA